MKAPHLFAAILVVVSGLDVRAETTPMDEPVPEETVTTITCELTEAPKHSDISVFGSAKDSEAAKGTYHYKLWIPKGYGADPQKRWPCMFVMSAGGNASMPNKGEYLRENGFVVVMLVEARNGPWSPIVGNFLAAHDDVVQRVRIDEERKYATGMSGGARGSSVFAQIRPGFCGLVLQAAGASYDEKSDYNVAGIKRNQQLFVAMTMGSDDRNKSEVDRMKKALGPHRFEVFEFDGGHTWAPPDAFEKAMDWIESSRGKGPSEASDSFDDFFKKK